MPKNIAFKTRAERAEIGRSLRKTVPRSAIGDWRPAPNRPDPIAILEAQAADRVPRLVPIRHRRMAESPFAFFRGAAAIMAADLASTPSPGIRAQLCGDAHVSNFGLFAAADRRSLFDINDFDETIHGPFEWDLLRLAASIAVAANDSGFSDDECEAAVLGAVTRYRQHIHELSQMELLDVWYSRIEYSDLLARAEERSKQTRKVAEKALRKSQRKTTEQAVAKFSKLHGGERRIVADPPLINPLTPDQIEAMSDVITGFYDSFGDAIRRLTRCYRIVDVAEKVVGVGSVGLRALIVLLQNGDGEPLFLQFKQAVPSVLAPFVPHFSSAPSNQGQRVVEGQRAIQGFADPFLGWSRGTMQGKEVDLYCRQLRDMKGSIDATAIGYKALGDYAAVCGRVLARAHARAGDAAMIAGYLGGGDNADNFDRSLAHFAMIYTHLNRADHAALLTAIHTKRLEAADHE